MSLQEKMEIQIINEEERMQSGIKVPVDYETDKNKLNQEELLASLGFIEHATIRASFDRGIEEEERAIHVQPSQSFTGTTLPAGMHKQSNALESNSREHSVSRINHTQQSQQPGEALADRVLPSLGDKDSDLEVEGALHSGDDQQQLEFQNIDPTQGIDTIQYGEAQVASARKPSANASSEEHIPTYRDEKEVGAIETSGPNYDMGAQDEEEIQQQIMLMGEYTRHQEQERYQHMIEEERRQQEALLRQIREIEALEQRQSFAPMLNEQQVPYTEPAPYPGYDNTWGNPAVSTGGNDQLLHTSDNQPQMTPMQNELLTITIDIGGGQQENIQVFEGDDPFDLARQFAQKHNLDPKLTDLLAAQIQSNIDQVILQGGKEGYEEENQMMYEGENQQQQYEDNQYASPMQGYHQEDQQQQQQYYSEPPQVYYGLHNQQQPMMNYQQRQQSPPRQQRQQSPFNTKSPIQQALEMRYRHPQIQPVPHISERSRRLALLKRPPHNAQQPVHIRLYNQELEKTQIAMRKQQEMAVEQQEMAMRQQHRQAMLHQAPAQTQQDGANGPLNIGVRLYQKGIKKQEEKERYCKQLKEVEELLEQRELVFKPHLIAKPSQNTQSTVMRDKSSGQLRKEEELIMYGRMLNEKKEMARVINSQYEESRFDFVPKINKKSEKIVQERSRYLVGSNVLSNHSQVQHEAGGNNSSLQSPKNNNGRTLEEQLRSIGMSGQQNQTNVESPQQYSQYTQQQPGGQMLFSPKSQGTGTKFHELYDDARLRKERFEMVKKEMLDKECTFKPHLVTKESRLTKSVLTATTHPNQPTVVEQHINQDIHQARVTQMGGESNNTSMVQLLQQQKPNTRDRSKHQHGGGIEDTVDAKTGQPLFRPQTGRSPRHRRHPTEKIGEHLYSQHKALQEKQEKLKREDLQRHTERRRQVHTANRKTDRIIETSKREMIMEIFEMLRVEGDTEGIISAQRIDLHSLPTKILEVFQPLLIEMEELGTTLNQEEFLDASLRLYQTLNIQDRGLILNFNRSSNQRSQGGELSKCTFYPQLNPKSLKMVSEKQHKQPTDISSELADKLIRHHNNRGQYGGTFSPFSQTPSGVISPIQHIQ
ncbi:hypothetical protein FGO68_gene11081 [Halteria grandinella]|uniref:Uncharacterized protein n=1 Tax=Halteria grandinella TaxID=5974 RepID=A0A8J8P325_HALGN|nr:hypothetical protein FGO68_gene11081 [Halteria grandinella]